MDWFRFLCKENWDDLREMLKDYLGDAEIANVVPAVHHRDVSATNAGTNYWDEFVKGSESQYAVYCGNLNGSIFVDEGTNDFYFRVLALGSEAYGSRTWETIAKLGVLSNSSYTGPDNVPFVFNDIVFNNIEIVDTSGGTTDNMFMQFTGIKVIVTGSAGLA